MTSNPLKCRGSPRNSRYCKDGAICTSKFGNLQYSKRMLVKNHFYQCRLTTGTFGLYIWPMIRVLWKLKINATANQILKRSTTRTNTKSFLPGIFGLFLDLYIDFLAFFAHYLQITHAVAWNYLCNRAIYLIIGHDSTHNSTVIMHAHDAEFVLYFKWIKRRCIYE